MTFVRRFCFTAEHKEVVIDRLEAIGKSIDEKSLYELTYFDHQKAGLLPLSKKYKGSHIEMLVSLFPEYNLLPWYFRYVPKHYWTVENQKLFFEWYKSQYNISDDYDWRTVDKKHLIEKGGRFVNRYKNLNEALSACYPKIDWETIFKPSCEPDTMRAHIFNMERLLKVTNMEEWKSITKQQLNDIGYGSFVAGCGGIWELKKRIADCKGDTFNEAPQDWRDIDYVRDYLSRLQKYYNIGDNEWHLITARQLDQFKGRGLRRRFGTILNAVTTAFPNAVIIPRSEHWSIEGNVRQLLDGIKQKLNIQDHKDWDAVSPAVLWEHGAGPALSYHGSKSALISFGYPDYALGNYRKPRRYYESNENIVSAMKRIEKELFIEQPQDWYRVSTKQLAKFGWSGLLGKHKFIEVLQLRYPDFEWDEKLIKATNKKAEQFFLKNIILQIYPDAAILEDYSHPDIKFAESGHSVELDLYLPDHNIAFEYHGEQHYQDIPAFGALELYQMRDKEKVNLCRQHDLPLIIVPFWWERSVSYLCNQIKQTYPELLPDSKPKKW